MCELVVAVFLGVELKGKVVVVEFLEVVCADPVVGVVGLVVVVGGSALYCLLQGCVGVDRKSTRLNSSHSGESRMPSSA